MLVLRNLAITDRSPAAALYMEKKALINYTKEAFSQPINLLFLAGAALVAGAAALIPGLNQLDLLAPVVFAAGGVEMLYLGLAPANKQFIRAVNAKSYGTTQRIEQQIKSLRYLTLLGRDSLEKYTELYRKKQQITENLARHSVTQGGFLDAYIAKVNTLENYFVDLVYQIDQYKKFLKVEGEGVLQAELAKITAERDAQTSSKVRDLYQKRINLIHKRLEKNKAVKEQLQVATIQLATLEDTINYLLEQTMTISNPNEVTRTIDSVLSESEEHHSAIQDIQGLLDEDYQAYQVDDLVQQADQLQQRPQQGNRN